MISSPEDTDLRPVLDAQQIVEEIKGLFVQEDLSTETHVLPKPTLGNFLDELDKCKPHVLHFIGYSRSNKKGEETAIALLDEDDEKSARWMSDRDFINVWVHGTKTWIPPLVFFQLCGSVTAVDYDIARLAFQLSRAADIPVVATQHPITHKAAKHFSKAFYRALARGDPIPSAVQYGRTQIVKYVREAYRDYGSIVLYMRNTTDGGIIHSARKKGNIGNSIQMME